MNLNGFTEQSSKKISRDLLVYIDGFTRINNTDAPTFKYSFTYKYIDLLATYSVIYFIVTSWLVS